MTETVMPAFAECPTEAAIISRILAGYGELEFLMCRCLSKPMGSILKGIKVLFKDKRSEEQRCKEAERILKPYYAKLSLASEAERTFRAINWCRNVRNTFAHATWAVNDEPCLFYVSLTETARGPFVTRFKPKLVDVSTLQSIEGYFQYTERCLRFLDHTASKLRIPRLTLPSEKTEPRMHSPLGKHVPPGMTPIR